MLSFVPAASFSFPVLSSESVSIWAFMNTRFKTKSQTNPAMSQKALWILTTNSVSAYVQTALYEYQ